MGTLTIIFANAVLLTISIVWGHSQYWSLDDFFMQSVLTGAYGGTLDSHLYFVSSVYAYVLFPFYKAFPSIGWYSIFQTLIVFASFLAICLVMLRKCGPKLGVAVSFLVLTCISIDFYPHVAFTQCAGVSTAAGILVLSYGLSLKEPLTKKRIAIIACGVAFLGLGMIFRKDMFLLGVPTLGAILLWELLKQRNIIPATLVSILAVVALFWGLKNSDSLHYTDNGYDRYAAYQPVRAFFGDGDFYDWKAFSDELEERDMLSRDFRYLSAWYFYDKDIFSVDSLKEKIAIANRNAYIPNYKKMPLAILRAVSNNVTSGRFWCWAILCIGLLFFGNHKQRIVPWASFAVLAIAYGYLLLVNRLVNHVEVGAWLYATIILLNAIDGKSVLHSRFSKHYTHTLYAIAIASLFLLGIQQVVGIDHNKNAIASKENVDWEGFLDYAARHPDNVFMLSFDRYKDLAKKQGRPFRATKAGSLNNIFSFGYWNILLPPMERELEKRGVKNPMHDIVNSNVYVAGDAMGMSLAPFYKDHYHKKLSIDTVMFFGSMPLLTYKLREGENEVP